MPGERDFRVLTTLGASTLGSLSVTRYPVVVDGADNGTQATAQPIGLPATVCGSFNKAEQFDFFKFTVSQPGDLTFHVQSRLQDKKADLLIHSDAVIILHTGRAASWI